MQHDEVFKGCDITYVPIFLGGLMHKVSFWIKPWDWHGLTESVCWAVWEHGADQDQEYVQAAPPFSTTTLFPPPPVPD